MAYLGAIGRLVETTSVVALGSPQMVNGTYPNPVNLPTDKTLSGVVEIDSVVTGGVEIYLYLREDMKLLNKLVSQADGTYQFKYLNSFYNGSYLILFQDPNITSPYNYTLARDHLVAG